MRNTIIIMILAVAVSMLVAGNPPEDTKSTPGFDKLKSLV